MDTEWIVGRKEIMAALHKDSWASVRRWKAKYGVKFDMWPNGQPVILRSILRKWLLEAGKAAQDKHLIGTRKLEAARDMMRNHDARGRKSDI